MQIQILLIYIFFIIHETYVSMSLHFTILQLFLLALAKSQHTYKKKHTLKFLPVTLEAVAKGIFLA